MSVDKAIIYYTDNRLNGKIVDVVKKHILKAKLPIYSCSLNSPIDFGKNIVFKGVRSYLSMLKQIILCLEMCKEEIVFFCENDVLYPESHFEFTPSENNMFYYNDNVYRWKYLSDTVISYDRLFSLSSLCVNRKYVLDHFKRRLKTVEVNNLDKDIKKEPDWARKWGYEPGTKKKKRGGFSDDDFKTWKSGVPIIDIRHPLTFTPEKTTLNSFKHLPFNWIEIKIDSIPGWNIRELFL